MTAPERSLLQRRDALERANEIRSRRSQLKKDIKAGRVDPLGLLTWPPDWLESMRVIELLIALPACGRVKANRVLNGCRISPSKTVGGMSDRQRRELLERLPVSTRRRLSVSGVRGTIAA